MANKNIFNSIQLKRPGKNFFDLTHDIKFTGKMGELYPVCCIETVPGDKFNINSESLVRFAPMYAPVMHRYDVTTHYFYVPNRILWPNWEEFITGAKLATAGHTERALPKLHITNLQDAQANKLAHLLGVGFSGDSSNYSDVLAFPFAAYNKIWNEYYRDQNLQPEAVWQLQDGLNTPGGLQSFTKIRKRAWMHDYFTSALPFAQKGETVDLPLGNITLDSNWATNPGNPYFQQADGLAAGGAISAGTDAAGPNIVDGTSSDRLAYDPNGSLINEPTTVNDLRRAFRLQEWLEKNARAGTRYVESILMHFGVKSSDARLQRPEYITGSKTPVAISEVLNTTGQVDGIPQGNMAGHGVSLAGGNGKSYYCEEHGYIIGIMSVNPVPSYYQGTQRHLLKKDRFDFYWPSFAHIGEQPIYAEELYIDGVTPKDQTFGYTPRYAEYRYQPNRIAGEFMTPGLDFWTHARKFDNAPVLNSAFIECNPDKRIFNVEDDQVDCLYIDCVNHVKAFRPLPKFGTPSF